MKFQICKWLFVIVKLRGRAARRRGRGTPGLLMDWKGMCLSSKRLPVNKDSSLPLARPPTCTAAASAWRGAVLNSSIFSQVWRPRGQRDAAEPVLTAPFRFLILLAVRETLAVNPERREKLFHLWLFCFPCVGGAMQIDAPSHCYPPPPHPTPFPPITELCLLFEGLKRALNVTLLSYSYSCLIHFQQSGLATM